MVWYGRGVYPPNGNDANFPFPSPLLPLPFPFLPSLPSPEVWGIAPSGGGPGCYPEKIEIGFGAFWRIFVSKRQLSIVSLFVNKN